MCVCVGIVPEIKKKFFFVQTLASVCVCIRNEKNFFLLCNKIPSGYENVKKINGRIISFLFFLFDEYFEDDDDDDDVLKIYMGTH